MQVKLVTLEGQVRSSTGEPIPDATVTLFGPGPGHEPVAPASAQAGLRTSWTLQVTGFDGDLDGCWERFLAHAGLDISRKKFLKKVEKHNPTLADSGRRLRAECVYLLPEQRFKADGDGQAYVWDRLLACFPVRKHQGFDSDRFLNLWDSWEKYVQASGVSMKWKIFKDEVVYRNNLPDHKPSEDTRLFKLLPGQTYILPRNAGPAIFTRVAITQQGGEYRLQFVDRPGPCRLEVQAPGYQPFVQQADFHDDQRVDISLQPKHAQPSPKDKEVSGGHYLVDVAGGATHLYAFSQAAQTADLIGADILELRNGATIEPHSDIPGCQGKLILPAGQPAACGVLALTYDWGRDRDRTWEIVFRVTQPGYGPLLTHPVVVDAQRILRSLGFDPSGTLFLEPLDGLEPVVLSGLRALDVGKTVYLALCFLAAGEQLAVTWQVEGEHARHACRLFVPRGQMAGGRLILGGAGNPFSDSPTRTAGFEIHHLAAYDHALDDAAIEKRLALLRLRPDHR